MFPRLIALDTDGTVFTGKLDQTVWGKGQGADLTLANNILQVNDSTLRDRRRIRLSPDIPRIVTDILKNGAALAIVSRNTSKELCDRALYYFKTKVPETQETKSIIHLVKYDEVIDEPISEHFKRIKGWSGFDYADMVMFGEGTNVEALQKDLGVSGLGSNATTGLTWERYTAGLDAWRRTKAPKLTGSTTLGIAHFNDVYQVTDQIVSVNGQRETINVMKFATLLSSITAQWKGEGLTIFSGDLFSPSTESSVTRGRHMPAIVNELGIDVSVAGNHEFDFGYPRLKQLISQTAFPWLLSNIIDTKTKAVPEPMKDIHVLTKGGVRIGFIGLVEKEWIATITGWPKNFEYQDMVKVGTDLSTRLRNPAGPHKCDLVIALTHCRIPNDIKVARDLGALSPSAQKKTNITNMQGVDLLLGGHDHVYWISKGVTAWEGYDLKASLPDAKDDNGDVLIVKSGTDYQDISEVVLTLQDAPAGCVRKKVIREIRGKRRITRGNVAEDKAMKAIFDEELAIVQSAMGEQLCTTEVALNIRSEHIRLQESAVGNWVADCLRNAYDEALRNLGYANGPLYLRDLMRMLPYPDPLVVVELSAKALWDTLESGLSLHPRQEGRFPAVSGLRVEWDSSQPTGKRVRSVSILSESRLDNQGNPTLENVDPASTARKYLIMVGEYMTKGGDGYDILTKQKPIITAEGGQSKSALVRKYLLGTGCLHLLLFDDEMDDTSFQGTQVLNQKIKENPQTKPSALRSMPSIPNPVDVFSSFTARSLRGTVEERTQDLQQVDAIQTLSQQALDSITPSVKWLATQRLVSAALQVAEFEDVGLMDPYERLRMRREARSSTATRSAGGSSKVEAVVNAAEKKAAGTFPVIRPVVDNRLRNIAPTSQITLL
ncbi:hypothetical protein ONZ45_g7602 [Pleurotus djamor]|nr:hypothetical protein ONZ45_g7602 [Pleurotus djamor]